MRKDHSKTMIFSSEDIKREVIRSNLQTVFSALQEKDTTQYIKLLDI